MKPEGHVTKLWLILTSVFEFMTETFFSNGLSSRQKVVLLLFVMWKKFCFHFSFFFFTPTQTHQDLESKRVFQEWQKEREELRLDVI